MGVLPSLILPVARFSSMNSRQSVIFSGERGYTFAPMEVGALSTNLISWSQILLGGKWSKWSWVKTSVNDSYSFGIPSGKRGNVLNWLSDSHSFRERESVFQLMIGLKCFNQSKPR